MANLSRKMWDIFLRKYNPVYAQCTFSGTDFKSQDISATAFGINILTNSLTVS